MDSLRDLAFAFARFVPREHRGFRFPRRTFGLPAARRRNFDRRYQCRPDRNGGLRHHGASYRVPRRRYGPGGGLRRRHTHRQHFHHVHRRVVVEPREEAPTIPQEVVAAPIVVDDVPEVAALMRPLPLTSPWMPLNCRLLRRCTHLSNECLPDQALDGSLMTQIATSPTRNSWHRLRLR